MLNNSFIVENGVLLKYVGRETDIIIPGGVEVIGEGCFKNSAIEKVTLSDTVWKIMHGAFENCEKLCCVIATENLTSVQIGAFTNCPCLEIVEII